MKYGNLSMAWLHNRIIDETRSKINALFCVFQFDYKSTLYDDVYAVFVLLKCHEIVELFPSRSELKQTLAQSLNSYMFDSLLFTFFHRFFFNNALVQSYERMKVTTATTTTKPMTWKKKKKKQKTRRLKTVKMGNAKICNFCASHLPITLSNHMHITSIGGAKMNYCIQSFVCL